MAKTDDTFWVDKKTVIAGSVTATAMTVNNSANVDAAIVANPGSSGQLHSPWLSLVAYSGDRYMYWRIRNEAYATSGGGGCLVFKSSGNATAIRRPFAIDEQGRTLIASGVGPYTVDGETIYGFHGEDFGSFGNWPLMLEGSIAGLNRVVVGNPINSVTSDLFITGKVRVGWIGGDTVTSQCTLSSGTAAPTNGSDPDGSIYMKRSAEAYVSLGGTWFKIGRIVSLNALTGPAQTFTNDTNVTIVSAGTAHVITWSGTLADARIASAATWNAKVSFPGFGTNHTTAAYGDHAHAGVYLPVSGAGDIYTHNASEFVTLSANNVFTGTITKTITGASYVDGLTLSNVSTGNIYDAPCIALTNDSAYGGTNLPITWRIKNESFNTSGGGGCFVLKVSGGTHVIRRPFAIDEQGRMSLGGGTGATYEGETSYGFHGEDFGSGGNFPVTLEASIAGLNKVLIGSNVNNVTSALYVTGVIYTYTGGAGGTAYQVVGAQQAAVADATTSLDVITQLNALLARLRTHGLIAT